ncbi:MAG: hypothetical protein KAH32_07315 [Chlamydiia bacterium]|nr:hypothetical protein [Chlamydiia bacterium]
MSVQRLIDQIKYTASLQGSLDDIEVAEQLNQFLHNDLMATMPVFNLRRAVSFNPISRDTDCFIASNIKSRTVASLKGPIKNLTMPLASYTNNTVYSPITGACEVDNGSYTTFSTQREGEFFRAGNTTRLTTGIVSRFTPLIFDKYSLKNMSNYWTSVVVKKDDEVVARLVFYEVIESKTIHDNSFSCMVNFKDRVMTLQYNGNMKGWFQVEVHTFESTSGILIKSNAIYGPKTLYRGMRTLFIDCFVHPRLVAFAHEQIDPSLQQIQNIITIGVAKNLSIIYQNSILQDQLIQRYDEHVKIYNDAERDKDMLEYSRELRIRDPSEYGSYFGYYGYGAGMGFGSGRMGY